MITCQNTFTFGTIGESSPFSAGQKLGGFDEVVSDEIEIEIHRLLSQVKDQILVLTKNNFFSALLYHK